MSNRAKCIAALTGRPPVPQSNSSRAKAISGHAPRQQPSGSRAKALAVGRNPLFEHLGKPRIFPGQVEGAREMMGQKVRLADGRVIRVMGLDVLVPDNEHTHAGAVSYGCAADARFMSQRLRPADRFAHAAPADATAVAHPPHLWPRPPQAAPPPTPPLTRQQQAAQQFGGIEQNWNGVGSLLEGYGLINSSITPVNNSAFQVAQRVNRLAGKKVIIPSHLASRAAGVVRTVAPSSLASIARGLGRVAGPAGMGLTFANIVIEARNDKWDAHTLVNGTMLVVSAAGLVFVSAAATPVFAVAGTVIVIYGVADYAFDIGENIIDPAIGRKSGLWD